ncbi:GLYCOSYLTRANSFERASE [Salix purpurea]|uniref:GLYCOSYLTRANSFERASE n=1 Tax=Salix purpurea TaxID=77065 RepID=A0A9Q0VW16_SALPP|nr:GLYCOSYLTRANSFERASE [Salix purpurea]
MESPPFQIHIAFFPFMAQGHIIPTVDMARTFARHGVKATIITTPLTAPLVSRTIERDIELGSKICVLVMKFPSLEAGLPEGCENASFIKTLEMVPKFFKAVSLLQQPLEHLLEECRPNCLVADMMFPWATKVAGKFGIPRLVFHGTSYFALCVSDCLKRFEPYKSVETDSEPFPVPGLPHKIKLTRLQLPSYVKENSELSKQMDEISQADLESYGVIMNSFHELEPAYSEHYKKMIGRKAWHIGPVSLCNRDSTRDKVQRGGVASIDER